MLAQYVLTAGFAALSASAVSVTAPSNNSGWDTKGSQLIQWKTVSTDPNNFTIQFVPPSGSPILITDGVKADAGSYIWTPTSDLSAGAQYRVNIVTAPENGAILAQSDYFTVKDGTSTVTPTSGKMSATGSMSQSASASNTAATSAAASSGAATHLLAPGGFLLFVAGALGVLA